MSGFVNWLQHDTSGLLTLAVLSVAVLLLLLIIKVKLEPFIALLVVGLAVGLVAGLPVAELVGTPIKSADSLLEKGFGGILGHIAPIIGLGTVLGAIMERSGGADVLATRRYMPMPTASGGSRSFPVRASTSSITTITAPIAAPSPISPQFRSPPNTPSASAEISAACGAASASSPAPGAPAKPNAAFSRSSTGGITSDPKATPMTSATCCFHGVAPTS